MPGPFPGMDPYLEAPPYWESFHERYIFHIGSLLQESLPDDYVAEFRKRVQLVLAHRDLIPDVTITRDQEKGIRSGRTGAARQPDEAAIVVAEELPEEERFIEIIRLPDERVVTVIELASPWNKISPEGRRTYFEKQRSILASDVHLIEIDLLRAGTHWAAVPESLLDAFRPYDYLVCTSRAGRRDQWERHFRTVRDPLPNIAVPLGAGDGDVTLPLQEAFDHAYDQGRYGRPPRYRQTPQPSLRPEDQEWADRLLRERGLLAG